ncbi:hypothetical protein GGR57DRAFT_317808 [Xylariaceae sp. FL1272]|nr:hypothetical protein GGR57DRAFT_317808 [Xylariaceae sp. FL1272]
MLGAFTSISVCDLGQDLDYYGMDGYTSVLTCTPYQPPVVVGNTSKSISEIARHRLEPSTSHENLTALCRLLGEARSAGKMRWYVAHLHDQAESPTLFHAQDAYLLSYLVKPVSLAQHLQITAFLMHLDPLHRRIRRRAKSMYAMEPNMCQEAVNYPLEHLDSCIPLPGACPHQPAAGSCCSHSHHLTTWARVSMLYVEARHIYVR